MKVTIDVHSRAEGDAIRIALNDRTTRASVVIVGTLLALETDDARQRVLAFVSEHATHRNAADRPC